jgi:small subunit ribosomal protein S18
MADDDRRRRDPNPGLVIDYKDVKNLKRFVSEDGKILPRRRSGLSAKNQRAMTTAIKRARHLALMPYANRD